MAKGEFSHMTSIDHTSGQLGLDHNHTTQNRSLQIPASVALLLCCLVVSVHAASWCRLSGFPRGMDSQASPESDVHSRTHQPWLRPGSFWMENCSSSKTVGGVNFLSRGCESRRVMKGISGTKPISSVFNFEANDWVWIPLPFHHPVLTVGSWMESSQVLSCFLNWKIQKTPLFQRFVYTHLFERNNFTCFEMGNSHNTSNIGIKATMPAAEMLTG